MGVWAAALTLVLAGGELPAGNNLPFQVYGTGEGLPAPRVIATAQDARGRVYVATSSGLAQAQDGAFVRAPLQPSEPSIQALLVDADDRLLVGTERGLLIVDAKRSTKIELFHDPDDPATLAANEIWSLALAADGTIYIGSYRGGLDRLGRGSNAVDRLGTVCADSLLSLLADDSGQVYLGSLGSGLCVRDRTGTTTPARGIARDATVVSLAMDGRGAVWAGTSRGLYRRAAAGEDFVDAAPVGLSAAVQSLYPDPDGTLWVGTAAGLLLLPAGDGQRARTYRRLAGEPLSLAADNLWHIRADRDQRLWLATLGGGLAALPADPTRFALLQPAAGGLPVGRSEALLVDPANAKQLYVGQFEGGLQLVDLEQFAAREIVAEDGRGLDRVWALAARAQTVYAATANTLYRLSDEGRAMRLHEIGTGDTLISAIDTHGSAAIYVGTLGAGLWRVDEAGPTRICATISHVHALARSAAGALLVGHHAGLCMLDGTQCLELAAQGPVLAVTVDADTIFLADPRGVHGLDQGKLQTLYAADGFQPRALLVVDNRIWVGSEHGLIELERSGRLIAIHDQRLPSARLTGALAHRPDWAVFGTEAGLVFFDPRRPGRPRYRPRLAEAEIYLLAGAQRQRQLDLRPLRLAHDHQGLAVVLRSDSTDDHARQHFETRLVGLEAIGLRLPAGQERGYSRLPPGQYSLTARACSDDCGDWQTLADVVVEVPPWRSPPALAAYLVASVLLILLMLRAATAVREQRQRSLRTSERLSAAEQHRDLAQALLAAQSPRATLEAFAQALTIALPGVELALEAEVADTTWQAGAVSGLSQRLVQPLADGQLTVLLGASAEPERLRTLLEGYVSQVAIAYGRAHGEQANARLAVAAQAASRATSEFLATMSHEIRTPLHGMFGMTELLKLAPLSPIQQAQVQMLERSQHALLAVLNDVLDFSRLKANQIELNPEYFELEPLLDGLCDLYAPAVPYGRVELAYYLPLTLPTMRFGDPYRLRQILVNLVGNALKFTEAGGVFIEVIAGPTDVLEFCVSDSGIGIDEADMERLFEPFAQADGSISRRYGGSGLGLAIASRLVEQMGGSMKVSSQPGRGSSFSFSARLPAPESATVGTTADRPPVVFAGTSAAFAGARRWAAEMIERRDARPLVVVDADAGDSTAPPGANVLTLGRPSTTGAGARLAKPLKRADWVAAMALWHAPVALERKPMLDRTPILIVDPAARTRSYLAELIEALNGVVDTVESALEALPALGRQRYAAVLVAIPDAAVRAQLTAAIGRIAASTRVVELDVADPSRWPLTARELAEALRAGDAMPTP